MSKFGFISDLVEQGYIAGSTSNAPNSKNQENAIRSRLLKDGYGEIQKLPKDPKQWKLFGISGKGANKLKKLLKEANMDLKDFLSTNISYSGISQIDMDRMKNSVIANVKNNPWLEINIEAIKNKSIKLNNFVGSKYFMHQPCGSQDSPDFMIIEDNVILFLECKSGEDGKIMWNGGLPQKEYVYIYSSPLLKNMIGRESTLFLGGDIISDEIRNKLEAHHRKQLNASNQTINSDLNVDPENHQRWGYYDRAMYNTKEFTKNSPTQIDNWHSNAEQYINTL
jgi:hypothetical protein